jgi:hypothetical protein
MATPWALTLGTQHAARARATTLASDATRDAGVESTSIALARWPRIVEAMTRLVSAYNQGFGTEVLEITEDQSVPSRPSVMIRAAGANAPSLAATLEDSAIYARRAGPGPPAPEAEYRLLASRSDEETAAYLLQDWMAQLSPGCSLPGGVGERGRLLSGERNIDSKDAALPRQITNVDVSTMRPHRLPRNRKP